MSTKTLISVEEFAQMPKDAGVDYELVEGDLVPLASPTLRHAMVRGKFESMRRRFLGQNALGIGWRQIDVDKFPLPGAPDMAIEVLSPSESAIDMHRKTADAPTSVRQLRSGDLLQSELLPGFSVSVLDLLSAEV